MLIAGIEPFTLLDFPGKIACILFTLGCNFKCGYCHNAQFVKPQKDEFSKNKIISESSIFQFLDERRNLLDGVVICGGEPTIQPGIIEFLQKIKSKGFLIKLDTNGFKPEVLKQILAAQLIDYVAMDIKSSKKKYSLICGVDVDFSKIEQSRDLILNSNIDSEFRTTVIKGIHDKDEIEDIANFCKGTKKYVIQNFRDKETLDPTFKKFTSFSNTELMVFKDIAKKHTKTEVSL
jgi:pyruvate formate lyase activating enzyme